MRHYPEDDYDKEDIITLNAQPWMVEVLKLNPDYCSWGPHEDYMIGNQRPGSRITWRDPLFYKDWNEFSGFTLDDLNEVVNFYFSINRDNTPCVACDEEGYNPKTLKISRDFYDFERTGRRWCDKITQDEVDALIKANRLFQFGNKVNLTATEVNFNSRIHDAINRYILIETRAKRLGVWGLCELCQGRGHIFVEDEGRLSLTLWLIHPRKGTGRGVEIKRIDHGQLHDACEFLRKALWRNTARFKGIEQYFEEKYEFEKAKEIRELKES
jgi:hypothetical protein